MARWKLAALFFFFSSRRRHTRSLCDWSSDVCSSDLGTGTRTAMAQIAAEELGLPLDRVEVVLGDSSRGLYAVESAGSSTTSSVGPRAARALAARRPDRVRRRRLVAARGAHRPAPGRADPRHRRPGAEPDG